MIGYHHVIRRNGRVEAGRPLTMTGAHVGGHNRHNLGVCLVGGVNKWGRPENNFTIAQFDSLRDYVSEMSARYGIEEKNILGHRDWSPDLNGDGKITPDEFKKACPCFDVRAMLALWKRDRVATYVG